MNRPSVAVLGATGALGAEILSRLPSDLPRATVHAFASERSVGDRADEYQILPLSDVAQLPAPDVLIITTPDGVVIPNFEAGQRATQRVDLRPSARRASRPSDALTVLGPAASTIQRLIEALNPVNPIHRISGSVLESASMAGRAALDELRDQTIALLSFRTPPVRALPRRLAFDVLAETEPTADGQDSKSEELLTEELARFTTIPCRLSHIRLPVFIGLGLDLTLLFEAPVDLTAIKDAIANAPGIDLRTDQAPNLSDALGCDEVLVGRIRRDPTNARALNLWLVVDNLGLTAQAVIDVVKTILLSKPD